MLKQPSSYLYHSPSQQLHHPLFNTHKHNHTTQPYHHEQQSIQTIRAFGKLLFQEDIEHEIIIDDAYSQYRYQNNNSTKKKMTIYQRAEMKQKKKLEEKMQEEKKLSLKLMQQQNFIKHQKQTPIHHIESNHHHKTILPESKATKNYKLYSPNYQKDQFVQRQLFKKKITEQLQVQNNTTQRQYNNAGEKSYKNPLLIGKESSNMNYLLNSSSKNVQQKAKKKATAQQVDMIFEEVYKKGSEILKRRQSKVLKYRQEKWEQEMQDVTFHPHFYSSQKLRNMTQKDFLERLNNDSKNRETHKILILGEQLKKDSFEPKLNDHINTLSKSKIGSFRQHDTFYEQKSKSFRYSQSNLQKYLSRSQLIEQVSEIVTPEPFNRQTVDGLTAKDLKFLFQ